MGHYVDAEKLIAEIERRKEILENGTAHTEVMKRVEGASLQQEQPDLPGIEESGIPGKDYIPVEWVDACEKYGKWKIVKQEQPEGIEGVVHHYANVHYIVTNQEQLNARLKDFEDGAEVRVFINARKEDF